MIINSSGLKINASATLPRDLIYFGNSTFGTESKLDRVFDGPPEAFI